MYSVQELATECEVSVQAVRKWCARNNVSKSRQGGYLITSDVRKRALEHYRGKKNQETEVSPKVPPQVEDLIRQLEAKEAEIAKRDERIASLEEQTASLTASIQSLTESNKDLAEAQKALIETNKALSASTAIHTALEHKEDLLIAQADVEDEGVESKSPEPSQDVSEPPQLTRWEHFKKALFG